MSHSRSPASALRGLVTGIALRRPRLARLRRLRIVVARDVARQRREMDLVRARVPLRDEPRAAAGAMEPPLALHARDVAAEVVVGVELAEGGPGLRAPGDLAP